MKTLIMLHISVVNAAPSIPYIFIKCELRKYAAITKTEQIKTGILDLPTAFNIFANTKNICKKAQAQISNERELAA